jgi:hypothetical protein
MVILMRLQYLTRTCFLTGYVSVSHHKWDENKIANDINRYEKTGGSYGVNECLLASVLGSVVFSLLAAQPLCIVGVTGPITVFNYTVYNIITPRLVFISSI